MNVTVDFTIIITTHNRWEELHRSLAILRSYIALSQVAICDDASSDGTYEHIKNKFTEIDVFKNKKNLGLIESRNKLMGRVKTPYAISLDDDLNFLSENPFSYIKDYFGNHSKAAVLGFRIFWGLESPCHLSTEQLPQQVRSFPGGAHAFRMAAWHKTDGYPAWYGFYGEEDYIGLCLFKIGWECHYLPQVLTHHRVSINNRKKDKDYLLRLRCSLRAGWGNYLQFYPLRTIPEKMAYSIYMQLKLKVFKGELLVLKVLAGALWDVFCFREKRNKQNNLRLSPKEYVEYSSLRDTVLYWRPSKKNKR